MTIKDTVGLQLTAKVDNDGTEELGLFEFAQDVEINRRMRTSFVLDQTGDRALGALAGLAEVGGGATRRSGVTLDTGGGVIEYRITFKAKENDDYQWGDNSDIPQADATGENARRKANVLMRYINIGTFDSVDPAKLYLGEYESRGSADGVYEDFIPCTIKDIDLTVSAKEESILKGTITLQRVGTLGSVDNDGRREA